MQRAPEELLELPPESTTRTMMSRHSDEVLQHANNHRYTYRIFISYIIIIVSYFQRKYHKIYMSSIEYYTYEKNIVT